MCIRAKFQLIALCCFCTVAFASDWPQWHGPNRDNISAEKNLLKQWPKAGPALLWSIDGLGEGFSTVSKAGDSIYVTGTIGKEGFLSRIDTKGKLIWQKPYGQEWKKTYPGSRSTPTINGQNVYVTSGVGEVVCLDQQTGNIKWSVNAIEKYKGWITYWGIAESPLIHEEKLFCTPGGKNASIVALDKNTGRQLWTTDQLSDRTAFCSPILIDHHGKKQLVTVLQNNVVGVDIENGALLWKRPTESFKGPDAQKRGNGSTACTVIYRDECIYVSTGYNIGGAKLKIAPDSSSVDIVWKNADLDNHHGGVLLIGNYLYGSAWTSNTKGLWLCVDWQTGKTVYSYNWNENKGCLSYADNMLYCYAENTGTVALVKADPSAFNIISSFKITKGQNEHWTHPVIVDGRLYIRHGNCLMAYDISNK